MNFNVCYAQLHHELGENKMFSNTIIVDIDGTISKVGDRLKHIQKDKPDWDSFYNDSFEDAPIMEIIELVKLFKKQKGYRIVFCTGRRESVREITEKWIEKYLGFKPSIDSLLMRPNGDHRHDTEVKPEQLEKSSVFFSDVLFILEDRNSMVKKWRDLGYTCLQVAEGDF